VCVTFVEVLHACSCSCVLGVGCWRDGLALVCIEGTWAKWVVALCATAVRGGFWRLRIGADLAPCCCCFDACLLSMLCCALVCAPSAADGCFKVDLKGVLYTATVLPLAGTALVANMGPTEAKVRRPQTAPQEHHIRVAYSAASYTVSDRESGCSSCQAWVAGVALMPWSSVAGSADVA
jgi:hypothetical protein